MNFIQFLNWIISVVRGSEKIFHFMLNSPQKYHNRLLNYTFRNFNCEFLWHTCGVFFHIFSEKILHFCSLKNKFTYSNAWCFSKQQTNFESQTTKDWHILQMVCYKQHHCTQWRNKKYLLRHFVKLLQRFSQFVLILMLTLYNPMDLHIISSIITKTRADNKQNDPLFFKETNLMNYF